MRDRLIQKFTKAKKGSLGYTLMEMLVVVGIIAIVCAIAIPSVISISRALRFRQRNDYAKAIFMAAQANLTEMRSDGGLAPLRGAGAYAYPVEQGQSGFPNEDWSDEYVYIASQDASMEPIYALVLPVNSVESQLREQQVIIEYNPITGNVYSVFYSEDSQMKAEDGTEGTLLELYRAGKLPRNAEGDEKLRKDMMLGYYDGSGLSSSQLEMERTRAELEFENGEEGIVTVLVPMPDLYIGEYMEFMRGLEVELTLEPDRELKQGESQLPEIVLTIKEAGEVGENCSLDVDGRTVLITYVLDSLADRRSFANLSAGTYAGDTATLAEGTAESLTAILEETEFTILPGENVVITADVHFVPESDRPAVTIDPAVLDGVNPMFAYLEENLAGTGYTLAVENGRNLQNLNAIAPSVANQVSTVVLIDDIYWNKTVAYYNDVYAAAGNTYQNNDDEAPARRLPYFVPISNTSLFGIARVNCDIREIKGFINFTTSDSVPTMSDEEDTNAAGHAKISGRQADGSAARVYNLKIDATKYQIPNNTLPANPTDEQRIRQGHYYVTAVNLTHPVNYEFAGLFGYVNTTIDSIHVVNPIVKGYPFLDTEKRVFIGIWLPIIGNIGHWENMTVYGNPATGALVGATGYNCQFTNCATYIDTTDPSFDRARMAQGNYDKDADQTWYGVSGEGAVGGLVGYAKSHRTTNGTINGDLAHLAFSNCFAAVNVSGNMRGNELKHFGYSNGIGGLIGNSEITNFYNCYASGNVRANGCYVDKTVVGTIADIVAQLFGQKVDLLYNGRTSMGAGGFVGTSHGTRYTNCFSTGNVSASASRGSEEYKGAGGFVGIMSYEETYSYGNDDENNNAYAQHTVFENCYAAGVATLGGEPMENFSGANARIKLNLQTTGTYLVGNYYRALAPFYCGSVPGYAAGSYPSYETMYIFKDAYYLSQYPGTTQNNTNKCATVEKYENLCILHTAHRDDEENGWIQQQIDEIKAIELYESYEKIGEEPRYDWWGNVVGSKDVYGYVKHYYKDVYFDRNAKLEDVYETAYMQGFPTAVWGNTSATNTHPYSLALTGLSYPFSMINGLPYYGDWPGKPAYAGIAYYEDYENNTTGYYFNNDQTSSLKDNETIENDGYAILSANSTDTVTVTINGVTQQLSCVNNEQYKPGGLSAVEAYSVFRIPGTMYKTLAATQSDNFYVTANVTITNTDGETDTYTMYFNPFTAVSQVAGTDTAPTTNPKEVYIRTARQFAALSCERMRCVWGNKDVTITQQLDIDADEYDEYDWNGDGTVTDADKAPVLESIGNAEHPFAATYSGAGGYVSQAEIKGFLPETAFFGKIASDGTVRKLRISIEGAGANEAPVIIGLENDDYAAVVAAVSAGTLDDVDVTVTGELTIRARKAAGILVGNAAGTAAKRTTIQGCDVAAEKLTVNAQHAGGAIGMLTYGDVVKGQTAEMTEDSAGVVINGLFTAEGDAVGGFVGHATDLNVDALPIKLNGIAAEAQLVGGFAGSITTGTIQNLTLDLSGRYTAVAENTDAGTETKSIIAGAAAHAEDAAFQTVNVKLLGTLTGDTAAGVFGDAIDLTVQVTEAEITGTVNGTAAAAGMAANIEAGTFSGASVKLSGTIQAMGTEEDESIGRAAGFAVSIKGKVGEGTVALGAYTYTQKDGKNVSVAATTNSGYVKGNLEAAGFACEITADVTGSKVAGIGSVESDGTAAGFALKITGDGLNASENAVTPAFLNTTADYLYNSNANLKVIGNTASLFAVELGKGVTATNCYALGTVTGKGENPVISGFVDTNAGTINGASANVAMAGGYAFVRSNTGSIINSYGWYGDGKLEGNQTKAVINADAQAAAGTVTGSYFADLDVPAMYEDEIKLMDAAIADNYRSMVVYDSTGKMSKMAPTGLTKAILNGSGSRWFDAASYAEYPYSKLIPANYPYPKLRIHYGNWANPPQYAYGVVYYEQYADNTWKLAVQDLSNPNVTIEDAPLTSKDTSIFNKEGTIVDAGYALFFKGTADKNPMKQLTNATLGEALQVSHDALGSKYVYNFYKLIPSAATVTVTEVLENPEPNEKADSVTLGVYYAHEFGEASEHVVRTEAQLMRVAATGNYRQTHDIALSESYTLLPAFGGQYAGENCTISGADKGIMNGVTGSVTNLNVTASKLNASLFGTIGQKATVKLNALTLGTVGANGNVATTVNGTLTLSNNLVISGQVSSAKGVIETVNGVLNCSSVTVNGSLDGKLIGTVAANATFGISTINTADIGSGGAVIGTMKKGTWLTNGNITTGNVSGTVIGTLEGTQVSGLTVKTGLINQGGKVFGSVASGAKLTDLIFDYSGDLSGKFVETVSGNDTVVSVKNDLNLGSVSGSLFEKVDGGKVTVQNVTATAVSGKLFGDTAGEVTTGNLTVNGAVSGQLFGKVTGKVTVVDIKSGDISAKAQVFGDITADATVKTNNIVTSTIAAGTPDAKAGQIFGKVEGTVEVQHIKVSTGTNYAAVKGQVFGDITGKVTVATIHSSAVSGQIFGNVKNTAQNVLTVTNINTNGGEVSGQIFGAADYVTIKGIISTGEIKSTGKVFGNSAGTITVGAEGAADAVITTGNVSGQIFGDVGTAVVNGTISAGEIASTGKVFGTVKTKATITGQISVEKTKALNGKIFEGVAGEVILNSGITLGDIADSGEVFGDGSNNTTTVNKVTVGSITTGAVNGKIFADVKDVTVNGGITTKAVNAQAQVFGSVNGTVNITGSISTNNNAVGGQVFGAVKSGFVTVTGGISTGAVNGGAQIFGNATGNITVGAEGNTGAVITTGNVSGQIFGDVADVTINGNIRAGVVEGKVFGTVAANKTANIKGQISIDTTNALKGKIFEGVSGTVELTAGITLGDIGLNGEVFGDGPDGNTVLVNNVTVGSISTGTVNGKIFANANDSGTITVVKNQESNAAIATGAIQANAQIFGNVKNVTIKGDINTGAVTGKVFGTVSGTANITGSITVDKTADLSGKVFEGASGTVEVIGNITTGNVAKTGEVFGDGSDNTTAIGTVKVTGQIQTGNVDGMVFAKAGTVNISQGITTGVVKGQVFDEISVSGRIGAVSVGAVSGQVFGNVKTSGANQLIVAGVTVKGAVAGKVFGTVSGTVQINGSITVDNSTDLSGKVFEGASGTITVTGNITTGKVTATGEVFGDGIDNKAKVGNVTVNGAISTGAVEGMVFADATGTITVGKADNAATTNVITTGNVSGQIFGDVGTAVVNGTISAGEIASTGKVFGTVKTIATITGQISVEKTKVLNGKIFEGVAGEVILNSGITLGDIGLDGEVFGDGSNNTTPVNKVTVGSISTGTVNGKIFADVNTVTVNGSITTKAVNAKAQVFGSVNGTVNITGSISTSNNAVGGQIFGAVESGSVTVTGSISTGAVNGGAQIFGNATGTITVGTEGTTGAVISTGNVSGQIFGSVTTATIHGNISAGEVSGKVFGNVNTVTVNGSISTNSNAVGGQIFGAVESGSVTVTGSISTGAVSGKLFGELKTNVTVGGISTGAVTGNYLIEKLNSGVTLTTGDISVASLSESLIGTFNGGTVQGNASAQKTISIGSAPAYAPINGVLFGDTTNLGTTNNNYIKNYLINASYADAGLVDTLNGTLNNVTLRLTGYMNASAVAVANGNITTLTLDVTGELSASAIGAVGSGVVLDDVDVTAGTMTLDGSKVTGALAGSNSGTIQNSSVTAGTITVNNAVSFGVISGTNGSTMSGVSVKVDTLNVHMTGAGSIGGLVGVNSGTITGGTVSNKAANGAMAMTVDNANAAAVIIGGLTGTNSNTIGGTTSVKTNITYVQPTATNDSATIGALVGLMNDNSKIEVESGFITAAGAIQLKKQTGTDANGNAVYEAGSAKDRSYIIGGAIGQAETATAKNVAVNVTIGVEWLNAKDQSTTSAFAFEDMGPVGMFVGYTPDGNFTNCFALDEDNKTYQFLGQTDVEKKDFESNVWQSSVSATLMKAYSDAIYGEGGYTAFSPNNAVLELVKSYTKIDVSVNGCYFYLNEQLQEQKYAAVGNYYSKLTDEIGQISYQKDSVVKGSFAQKRVTIRSNTDYSNQDYYYSVDGGAYGKVTKAEVSGFITYTCKLYYIGADGKETSITDTQFLSSSFTYNLYMLNDPLTNNAKYMVVSGNTLVGENSQFTEKTAFEERNPEMSSFIFTYASSKLGTHTVGLVKENYYGTGNPEVKFTVEGLALGDVKQFNLYTVKETPANYSIYQFTPLTEGDYSYQNLTYATTSVTPPSVASVALAAMDLPGETGEASEATESTGSTESTESNDTAESTQATETATEPPAPEDGTNN